MKGGVRMENTTIDIKSPEIRTEALRTNLNLIVYLMGFIAEDFRDISCMDSIVVFDHHMKPLFYQDMENEKNTEESRALMETYMRKHKEIKRSFREVLKTGEYQKIRKEGDNKFLILPIEGVGKPLGIIGITYKSDGCEHEDCTTDQIFTEMTSLFITKYRELKEKEAIASMDSLTCGLKTLEDYERYAILKTGTRCNWNITLMAKELEIGRNTLYNKMRKMEIYEA